jgi:hypothetical protein
VRHGIAVVVIFTVIGAACAASQDPSRSAPAAQPDAGAAPATDSAAEPSAGDTAAPTQVPGDTSSTEDAPASADAVTPAADAVTVSFASEIEPIIEQSCASCHTGRGPGTQHVVMDTAADVAFVSSGLELVTSTGFMPPWPAGGDSPSFRHDWSVDDDQIDLLAAWHAAGAPLDVPDDHPMEPANPVASLEDPDQVLEPSGSYDGTAGQPDEYRCFVYDPGLSEPTLLSAYEFLPDQTEVVHHAVGFIVAGEHRDELLARDEGDGNGGWTCFGFFPAPGAQLTVGWAPGQQPTRYPEGSGLLLDAGDIFVIQIHYHFEVDAPADRSQFAVEWLDGPVADGDPIDVGTYVAPAEIPCSRDETGPLCDRDAALAEAMSKYGPEGVLANVLMRACGYTPEDFAGMTDGVASAACDQPAQQAGTVVGVLGHMHEIGASFRMTLNPGRPDEQVLLDIPRWDFDWQLVYEPVDDIVIERGDTIRLECTWDRGKRDPDLEPAYVLWADGTDDEMCFATLATRPS